MLHTLSHSPWQCDFACLLGTVSAGDDLLLLQDGVLAALRHSEFLPALQASPATVYLLDEDVQARGLADAVYPRFQRVSYRGFVRLAAAQPCQMSW